MLDYGKRKFLAGTGLIAGGVASGTLLNGFASSAFAEGNGRATHPKSNPYDFRDPVDNLKAVARVFADTSGRPVWFASQGRIYSMEPEHVSRPILSVEGLRRVRLEKNNNGYTIYMRDWAFYRDAESGELLDKYQNPFTGKTNETRQILTGLQSFELTPDGTDFEDNRVASSWLGDRPLTLPWMHHGESTSVSLEFMIEYANGHVGAEWMHFMAPTKDLYDTGKSATGATLFWAGDSPWIRWMEMGDRPGRTSWQSVGFKYQSLEQLRPELIAAAERYFPGSIAAPETYEKVSLTTSPEPDEN